MVAKVETVKAGQLEDTVTTTYRLEGTVKIIVVDQFGNSATGELTVILWITESPF